MPVRCPLRLPARSYSVVARGDAVSRRKRRAAGGVCGDGREGGCGDGRGHTKGRAEMRGKPRKSGVVTRRSDGVSSAERREVGQPATQPCRQTHRLPTCTALGTRRSGARRAVAAAYQSADNSVRLPMSDANARVHILTHTQTHTRLHAHTRV